MAQEIIEAVTRAPLMFLLHASYVLSTWTSSNCTKHHILILCWCVLAHSPAPNIISSSIGPTLVTVRALELQISVWGERSAYSQLPQLVKTHGCIWQPSSPCVQKLHFCHSRPFLIFLCPRNKFAVPGEMSAGEFKYLVLHLVDFTDAWNLSPDTKKNAPKYHQTRCWGAERN